MDLSAAALKFKGHQTSIKQVAEALRRVRHVLSTLAKQNALDVKLAEYAFFPLTHIFNDTQRLSASCLEDAIHCVILLVSRGWRQHVAPAMGKQLLILMSLIAGGKPSKQDTAVSDELKIAAFECISCVVHQLHASEDGSSIFSDVGTKTIVDQLVYLLLESMTDEVSDLVQFAAAHALLEVISAVADRVILASLLPRTASSLAQVLRTSTKARRTKKLLVTYLKLLEHLLHAVLADEVTYIDGKVGQRSASGERPAEQALDETWLRATATQVNIVILQVTKLRSHDGNEVRKALAELCSMVIEECTKSLEEAIPTVLDTLVYLAQLDESRTVMSRLESLSISVPKVGEILKTKFYEYCQSLPRTMQLNDERPKQQLLRQIETMIALASQSPESPDQFVTLLTRCLREGLEGLKQLDATKHTQISDAGDSVVTYFDFVHAQRSTGFDKLLMRHETQRDSAQQLQDLLQVMTRNRLSGRMARLLINQTASQTNDLVSGWLALSCLRTTEVSSMDIDSILNFGEIPSDLSSSRPYLISELYATLLPHLTEIDTYAETYDWRLTAVAVEATIMQAKQLEQSYRPELVDTLYPVLSLLSSHNEALRQYAITGLNLLSQACGYTSTSDMLIDNVDYLINAIGLKLNAFDVSPQAPQALLMMLRLCGARIIPSIDDLIGSMFSALDNFHGYPRLVEMIFKVLQTVVDESKARPQFAITTGLAKPAPRRNTVHVSTLDDILCDLRQRRDRNRRHVEEGEHGESLNSTPREPWTSKGIAKEDIDPDEDNNDSPEDVDTPTQQPEKESTLSKPHTLLLNIARATSPHLSSPSPSVRHTLLDLLVSAIPLLALHENSFLPLINDLWPSVVSRLFTPLTSNLETGATSLVHGGVEGYGEGGGGRDGAADGERETSYNIVAAAEVVTSLCREAGDFMSTRIESVFPRLKALFESTRRQVAKKQQSSSRGAGGKSMLVLPPSDMKDFASSTAAVASATDSGDASRTAQGQILAALVKLLCSILEHGRLSDEMGEQIVAMLGPWVGRSEEVTRAIGGWSEDGLWLLKRKEE